MKNKKKITLLASLCLVGVLAVGGTLAYFTSTDVENNTFTMGKVAIDLSEPEFSKNEDNTIKNVAPNQPIEKDPTVTVASDSLSAYVRLKFKYTGLSDEQAAELTKGIELNDGWKIVGNYIYFDDTLAANEKATAFNLITIPSTWGNEIKDTKFEMNITAEAVQADYFTPNADGTWPDGTFE